jgi:phosphatidylinositol alpha-1,6-mannosyltransferase
MDPRGSQLDRPLLDYLGGVPAHPIFVTRKFPPSVGGMETLAAGVWRSVAAVRPDAEKISYGGANRGLVWWIPLSLLRLAFRLLLRRVDFVLTGDALMYALASPLLRISRVPNATMIMGLDVTYENPIYRRLVRPALRHAPRVVAISAATADSARTVGVADDRLVVLRLGVQAPELPPGERRRCARLIRDELGLSDSDVVLLALGRLVRRKGVRWFVEAVVPELPDNVHLVVAGDGDEAAAIVEAAATSGVSSRVHLLGRVEDDSRERLMRGADVFVQPNIEVPNDIEGFGLVTVEAAMRGAPVVAANLQGIRDAVVDGGTGILLAPQEAPIWVKQLTELTASPALLDSLGESFRSQAVELYGEAAMGKALIEMLELSPRQR